MEFIFWRQEQNMEPGGVKEIMMKKEGQDREVKPYVQEAKGF